MSSLQQTRRPLRRIELQFEPVEANLPEARVGPLEVVRRPLQRGELQPVQKFDLILSLDTGADAVAITLKVIELVADLDRVSRANGGAGLNVDTEHSHSEPGAVTLRVVRDDGNRSPEPVEALVGRVKSIPGVIESALHNFAA